jgi:hypothetical protein
MILYEIDDRIAHADQAGERVVRIRLGQDVAPQFIVEAANAGHAISLDGSPTEYRGIPLEVGAVAPGSVVVETEPSAFEPKT